MGTSARFDKLEKSTRKKTMSTDDDVFAQFRDEMASEAVSAPAVELPEEDLDASSNAVTPDVPVKAPVAPPVATEPVNDPAAQPAAERVTAPQRPVAMVPALEPESEPRRPAPKAAASLEKGKALAPTSRAGRRSRGTAAKTHMQTSVVRNIPKALLTEMIREFPNANNQTDALVAYVICHSPGSLKEKVFLDLTDTQMDLIDGWDGNMFSGIEAKLDKLSPKVDTIQKLLRVVEVLSMYMTFDRLGFRNSDPLNVDDVDINEEGLLEFLIRLEGQSAAIQREKDLTTGR